LIAHAMREIRVVRQIVRGKDAKELVAVRLQIVVVADIGIERKGRGVDRRGCEKDILRRRRPAVPGSKAMRLPALCSAGSRHDLLVEKTDFAIFGDCESRVGRIDDGKEVRGPGRAAIKAAPDAVSPHAR
jgi:hypothetical protein